VALRAELKVALKEEQNQVLKEAKVDLKVKENDILDYFKLIN
jgi:hypothetical protein